MRHAMMSQATTETLEQKNLRAEIFSIPSVIPDLTRMLREKRPQLAAIAREVVERQPRNLVFFGSGGSSSALYSGFYTALSHVKLPADFLWSPDVVSARPAILDGNSVAVGASYSGKTMDTMRARQFLLERGVPLFSITKKPEAELAKGATWSVTYDSVTLYSSPACLAMLFVVELARTRGEWSPELTALEQALEEAPELLEGIAESSRQLAEQQAPQLDEGKILVLSGGCAYTLGYMMAYDMFGEYLKEYCAHIHYGEFRHGPVEIVRAGEPTMLFLMGNDRSRPFACATLEFGRRHGARTVVFDAAELAPAAHPLLDALVLYQSQLWLLYYMACRRGIDLDVYKYMHVVPYSAEDTFF